VAIAQAVMLAYRRADIEDLNGRARELMRAAGTLGEPELRIGGREYAVGDRVLATGQKGKRLGLVNAARGDVVAADLELRALTVRRDQDGELAHLPAGYLESAELHHAYALTIHKAQGMTVERAFVLGGGMYSELAYTALTRARSQSHLFLAAPAHADEAEGPVRRHRLPEPMEKAIAELERSRAHETATDTTARARIEHEPTAVLYAQRRTLERDLAAGLPAGAEVEREALAHALGQARERLRRLEARQHQAEQRVDPDGCQPAGPARPRPCPRRTEWGG
jgi:hypothetical protein